MIDQDDPRVLAVAREYLAELEAGRTPSRSAFEGRYPELRVEVAECLDGVELAHAAGAAFRPAPSPVPLTPDTSPEPLGDFRIVREIGRGGMGVVYEAVQLSLGRRVALKVLPFAAGMDEKHLQRFKTEAHAAAQLHHTNIVPVYAVGQDRGTHYYAMQLIDGRPLDVVIRELRNDQTPHTGDSTVFITDRRTHLSEPGPHTVTATTSRRDRTAFITAARLAAQVADALEYAHDAGVIHRDIKPANLLLDGRGKVWVTDFGLAQVQAEANVTRTGDVFGTLRYSSPEQATGRRTEVDHRTDVYSLGATLYELLSLQPIFPDTDRQSLLFRIIHEEPVAPRKHDKGIPPELETIVLKAVAKAPAERYQSAGEFAADLRRFLDDRPILARRPTFFDHTRKWLRRHPAYTYAAVVVLLLTAVGFGISTLVVAGAKHEAENAKKDVEDSLAREQQRATEAEERFQIARRLADEHIRVANEDLANDPVQESLRQRMLQTALAYYQEFIELRKDDPSAVEELKAVRDQVSGILSDLAVMAGAGRLELLTRRDVIAELKLDPETSEYISDLLNSSRPDFGRHGEFSPEQVNARLLENAKQLDSEIRPLLSAAQVKRLDQLFLQSRGSRAFDRPEVIEALKLTAEDRDNLRQIEMQGFAKRIENLWAYSGMSGGGKPGSFGGRGGSGGPGGFGGGGGGPGGGRPPWVKGGPGERGPGDRGPEPGRGAPDGGRGPEGGRRDGSPYHLIVAEMVASLRPEQQTAWKALVGEQFTFENLRGGPGGGRFGGR